KSSNGNGQFVIYSGTTGSSSSVSITAGTSDARSILGLNTLATQAGTDTPGVDSAYTGTCTVSGTYTGARDDVYNVIISDDILIGDATADASNLYGVGNSGEATSGGFWNESTSETYTITVDTTNGQTVGGGTGNVPT